MNVKEIEAEKEKLQKVRDEYNRTHYAGEEISKRRVRVNCLKTFTMHNGQTCIMGTKDTIPENYIADLIKARYIELVDVSIPAEKAVAPPKAETRKK